MKYQIRAGRLTVALASALLLIGCDSQNMSAADPQKDSKDSPAKSLFAPESFQPEIVESGGTTYFLTKDGELYERDSDVFLKSNFLGRTTTTFKDLKDDAPFFPINFKVRLEYVNGAIRGSATARVDFIDSRSQEFYSDLDQTLVDTNDGRCAQPIFLEWPDSASYQDPGDQLFIAPLAPSETSSDCKALSNFEETYSQLVSRWEGIKEYNQCLAEVSKNFFAPSNKG